MIEGIFQIMEGMEPPWITPNVMEVAAVRYPDVDRETLRLIIMTVMMTQRRIITQRYDDYALLGPGCAWGRVRTVRGMLLSNSTSNSLIDTARLTN